MTLFIPVNWLQISFGLYFIVIFYESLSESLNNLTLENSIFKKIKQKVI